MSQTASVSESQSYFGGEDKNTLMLYTQIKKGDKWLDFANGGFQDVTKWGERWSCNCPWGQMGFRRGACSHVLAVQAQTPETQAVVAPLAAVIKAGLAKLQADAQAQLDQDEAELEALFRIA